MARFSFSSGVDTIVKFLDARRPMAYAPAITRIQGQCQLLRRHQTHGDYYSARLTTISIDEMAHVAQ